ncbi:hypothetical protein [Fodinibius halophilus]|uniref:Uncharacterized protein n=1 Tax=Fodinibius halophilus TaxID=1736908 RepID=A0A6M1T2E7_9BACT|nr:hypothetical protein [Fodinibius halophilus]NGP90258.1 hypothetical protein [Fodinibius halophilus]
MIKKTLTILTLVLSIFTPILYFIGLKFHEGFIKEFGFSAKLFPLTVPKSLVLGFQNPFLQFFDSFLIWGLKIMLVGSFIYLLIGTFQSIRPSWFFGKDLTSIKNKSNEKKEVPTTSLGNFTETVAKYIEYYFFALVALFSLLIAIILLFRAPSNLGQEEAQRIRDNYQEVIHGNYNEVLIKYDSTESKGIILKHSENYTLAYFKESGATMFDNTEIYIDKIDEPTK